MVEQLLVSLFPDEAKGGPEVWEEPRKPLVIRRLEKHSMSQQKKRSNSSSLRTFNTYFKRDMISQHFIYILGM